MHEYATGFLAAPSNDPWTRPHVLNRSQHEDAVHQSAASRPSAKYVHLLSIDPCVSISHPMDQNTSQRVTHDQP
jgi:hypothetical protein